MTIYLPVAGKDIPPQENICPPLDPPSLQVPYYRLAFKEHNPFGSSKVSFCRSTQVMCTLFHCQSVGWTSVLHAVFTLLHLAIQRRHNLGLCQSCTVRIG